MKKVKVCHISTVHKAFDVRIFHKECVALANAGFEVYFVVQHDKNETVEGVNIVQLPVPRGRFHRIFFVSLLAFFRALKTKSKIFHFHDPELLPVGILLRIFGKKVIYDNHELVYHQIDDKNWIGNRFIRKIVAKMYQLLERIGVLVFNRIVLAEDGYLDYFNRHYRKKMHKVVLVRNYPILSMIFNSKKLEKQTDKFLLVYAGGLFKIRGLKEVCDAVESIDGDLELLLMGKWESEPFKNACLSGMKKIKYLGQKPLAEVFPIMKMADIGVSTLYPVENYLTSQPVKAFEYMACELPMIMSDFPYWLATFKDQALFVDPTSISELREKILWAMNNQDKLKEMGASGLKLVQEKYSWEAESKNLIAVYKSILN